MNRILLSFDVEEFDTPLEYGHAISEEEQFRVSLQGLLDILALLERTQVTATFFTTANFAVHHPDLVRQIAIRHEVASHGFFHGTFADADLARSKAELERITGQPVVGFRRARMAATGQRPILDAGYRYNSSENPTWIPGRYNHFFDSRRPYYFEDLLNIPASVTPLVRFPLFWLSFKNFPLAAVKLASRWTLQADGCLNLYFHPWEFSDLSSYRVPRYVKRIDGQALADRLERYIRWLRKLGAGHDRAGSQFMTFRDYDAFYRAAHGPPTSGA
jgi:peptidoglycan/xylan/chitin deacetylase (PgdA/CDA1 family)